MPIMTAEKWLQVNEVYRSRYPFCPICDERTVSDGTYIRGLSQRVRLSLYCPNRERADHEDAGLYELTPSPEFARRAWS